MNTVYRTYEILIEETLSTSDPKRQKSSKPSRENLKTRRAFETTHRVFQDAVCYYMLCLIGLVRNATETGSDGTVTDINPLWRTLTTGEQGKKTNELVCQLRVRYPNAAWSSSSNLTEFRTRVYDWKKNNLELENASLEQTYRILFSQAVGSKSGDDFAEALENLKSFAGTWIAILCNENGNTTIPGGGVYDVVHRRLKSCLNNDSHILKNVVTDAVVKALEERTASVEQWHTSRLERSNRENETAKGKKSPEKIRALIDKAVAGKIQKEAITLRDAYLKSLSPEKTTKYCSLSPEQIQRAIALLGTKQVSVDSFPRLRFEARDNSFEQPLLRYLLLRSEESCSEAVTRDVWDYVRKEDPEHAILDEVKHPLTCMPYQSVGNEPLFPYFTNCLGVSCKDRSVWWDFDKSAFKRAAEEVFKYRIRSDKRLADYRSKANRVLAMQGKGEWADLRGATKQLGGLLEDPRGPLMEQLLAEIGGSIGYGLRRGTIGGWGDLREDFLKAAKIGDPDGESLEVLVTTAQSDSGGGFGSAALFKKLCEPEYFSLWQENWSPWQPWHPKNFLSWYVRYAEAVEELKALAEDDIGSASSVKTSLRLKPISVTLPGTKNKHGEVSFRPFDFYCPIEQHPNIDLFDRDETKQYRLVRTNTTSVKEKIKDSGPEGADYPLTLSYRRLKRDRITLADGSSMEAFYQPPLVVEGAPDFHQEAKAKAMKGNKPYLAVSVEVSSTLLPPTRESGPFHLTMAMLVDIDGLSAATPKIDDKKHPDPAKRTENSVRFGPPLNGKYTHQYLRWPIDAVTEKKTTDASEAHTTDEAEGEKPTKFSAGKLWCVKNFDSFHILSVDLGVRFAGAWCRAKVFKGEPQAGQRIISAETDQAKTGKVVFGVEDVGTFRLQGEDVKLWRKRKGQAHHTFEQEPCGSRGRKATEAEIATFVHLAKQLVPATSRSPLLDAAETKYYPQLASHLQFRLARRLGQLRMLFNLRWRAVGRWKKDGHVYRELSGTELEAFQLEQRLRTIDMLDFSQREDIPDDQEEEHMEKLRLSVVDRSEWEKLTFALKGKTARTFGKQRTKAGKEAQAIARNAFRRKLTDTSSPWDWNALEREATRQIEEAMTSFSGTGGLISRVAHFVWPLIKKRWNWQPCGKEKGGKQSVLECVADETAEDQNITGMRGLNMRRVELLQEFRRCCQSLAKLERRRYQDSNGGLEPSPVRERDEVHEPAPAWIDKVNELREQRVNQTAHLILAEALGVDLMNPDEVEIDGLKKAVLKTERDVHGRYKKNPNRPRVAAIVLEDLSRYRTSQDRSRFENRQLMEWSHRQVLTKLQDMSQVFGIPIFTVDARFSSRFSSRTGVPGIRCVEVSKGFEAEHPWKKWAKETVIKPNGGGERMPSERAKLIETAATQLTTADSRASLILPLDGGPSFLPVQSHHEGHEGLEANADINAAVSIGLRAVAHPDRLDVFPLLKAIPKTNGGMEIVAKRGSFAAKSRVLTPAALPVVAAMQEGATEMPSTDDDEAESGKIKYVFACPKIHVEPAFNIPNEKRYELLGTASGAVSKIYWSRVKETCLSRITNINAARLAKWRDCKDEIPM